MLRLTLCSSIDGRFLGRVIDRDGHPFVLDFGDRRMIDDVAQRISRGFTMFRFGRLVHCPPQDPDMLQQLADYYAGEGFLVFLEEPNWSGRTTEAIDPAMRLYNARSSASAPPLEDSGPFELVALPDLGDDDDDTESVDDEPTELSRRTVLPAGD